MWCPFPITHGQHRRFGAESHNRRVPSRTVAYLGSLKALVCHLFVPRGRVPVIHDGHATQRRQVDSMPDCCLEKSSSMCGPRSGSVIAEKQLTMVPSATSVRVRRVTRASPIHCLFSVIAFLNAF